MHTYRGYTIVEHHGSEDTHFHTQFVRDGDKALIPSDCGGGFATVEEAQADIDSIRDGQLRNPVKIKFEIDADASIVPTLAAHIRQAAEDMATEAKRHPLTSQDPNTRRYLLLGAAWRLHAAVEGL